VPLTHAIELSRTLFHAQFSGWTVLHVVLLAGYTAAAHFFALHRMRKRVLR
jgi:ABC-type uncharacterized transport system permease subunit